MNEIMNEIKTSTDQRNFCMIYHDFLDSDFLNGYEKMIFIYLKRFADSEGKCFPSISKLELSGFSRSTIKRTLKSLEEKKVLSIEHRKTNKGNKSNIYILYDLAEIWQKKELSHATTTDAQKSPYQYKIDNKTVEEESQDEKLQCADSKNIENADIENEDIKNEDIEKKSQEEKRAEQEEKDQNGSGIESVNTLAAYETLIKENIAYADLCNSHQYDVKFIDEIVSNILDVVMSHSKTIKIANEYKNIELVKSVLLKLNYYQIEYVIEKYKQVTTKITNKRQYILTMLYNARLESESDVINEVAHDLSVLPISTSTTRDREKDIKNLANSLLSRLSDN